VIRRSSQRRFSWDLAPALAARSPGLDATRATRAAAATSAAAAPAAATLAAATTAAAATSEAAATSAANKPATAATSEPAAPAAATSAATTTAAAPRDLYAAANVFPIEDIERGETDVGHFLFVKNEALIGRGIVRLRDTGSGHCGCGCTTHQRKTQSGDTEHFHSGGSGRAFLLRSLLDP
jgi:hypothetical protein